MNRRAFEEIVRRTLDELPDWVLERLDNLEILVEEDPTPEQDPGRERLLGLYDGLSLPERGPDYAGVLPDVIYIFRQPHLELRLSGEELAGEIRRTLLHELAHYFGIEDDHLDRIGWG